MTDDNRRTKTTTTWGHQIKTKVPATIRILLQNIRGIDMTEMGLIKLAAMRNFINEAEVDICAITECNVDWKKAPNYLYPSE